MTMLDGGEIKANLNFDDFGNPLSTAQGNMADIVCDYIDFLVSVEVTTSSGQKQYDMEGEPVSRHLGKIKKESNKPCYCLFIAPTINEACIAHFYALHSLNISYYGGKSTIIPLPLNIFQKMLEDSYKANYIPTPYHVKKFFEYSNDLIKTCKNEIEWYDEIKRKALNWLNLL
ncbi:MAG: AlwI family type II restriction endonuclease, partial [Bacteroidales bacterium]|nr:AlwI family type II restriction endonuclease [Bacteroidales bacterium]